ncbi:MAG: hypothetical protein ACXAD7_19195 [Candidatus Kariarchaeaceae archaeon]|jgi:heme A synthase
MSETVERIIDILVFGSGIVLLIVGVIFLQLYFRYRRRDYFLYTLALFAAAVQATIGELDTVVPESWGTEVLELISAIFSFFMVTIIVIVLLYPDRVPIDFEEKIVTEVNEV